MTDTEVSNSGVKPMMKGGRRLSDGSALYWWVEILAILGFYIVYSAIRNANGSHPLHAFHDAQDIIKLEHHLGIFHEATIQRWALHCKPLIIAANYVYGSLHFIVTIWVAVWLFRSYSDDYPRYRNTLAVTTALALIGFTIFPLMPPRLLHDAGLHLGFVDTLQRYPTFWSFDSGPAATGLQPVRGHAERAHRVVHVVRARVGAAHEDAAPQDPRRVLPGDDADRDRDHREPLRHRRGRRAADPLDRLGDREQAHPRGPRPEGGRRDRRSVGANASLPPAHQHAHDVVHGLVGQRELHAARGDEREATGRHARDAHGANLRVIVGDRGLGQDRHARARRDEIGDEPDSFDLDRNPQRDVLDACRDRRPRRGAGCPAAGG